jgi:hypothetical protein
MGARAAAAAAAAAAKATHAQGNARQVTPSAVLSPRRLHASRTPWPADRQAQCNCSVTAAAASYGSFGPRCGKQQCTQQKAFDRRTRCPHATVVCGGVADQRPLWSPTQQLT